jgi:hypothetical protein
MLDENPLDEKPPIQQIRSGGVLYRLGARVRIWPRASADILDMALRGRTAKIVSIEQDLEDKVHLAVAVDDDPGSDLGETGLPGHRFFFRPGDVQLLNGEAV